MSRGAVLAEFFDRKHTNRVLFLRFDVRALGSSVDTRYMMVLHQTPSDESSINFNHLTGCRPSKEGPSNLILATGSLRLAMGKQTMVSFCVD